MELLDTENGSRHGSDGDDDDEKAENASTRLEQYVERFIAPGAGSPRQETRVPRQKCEELPEVDAAQAGAAPAQGGNGAAGARAEVGIYFC